MGLKNPDAVKGLHHLLLKAVPPNKYGNKTVLFLAELIPCHRAAITKWIKNERITPEKALRLVEISKIQGFDKQGKPVLGEARISRAELDPYVYNV
jgi:hypothetical protein